MTRILILSLLICFQMVGLAQEDQEFDYSDLVEEEEEKEKNGFSGIVYSMHTNTIPSLRNTLASNGFPNLEDTGSEFHAYWSSKSDKRFNSVTQLTWYDRSTVESLNNSNSANLKGFGFGAGTEWRMIDTKSFFIKPAVLVNIARYRLNITENPGVNSLDGLISSAYKEYSLTSFQFPLEGSLKIGFRFARGKAGFSAFIQAGYKYHWNNQNWKLNSGQMISDVIDLSSPYFSIGVGSPI